MKTRVIWIIDGLGPGGAEQLTLSILKKFDREKFEIRVCVLQEKHGNPIARDLEQIGIPVDMVHIPVLRHPANLPKLLQYLRKHKPHILHTQLEFADILGNFAAALLGIPSVSTQHTLSSPEDGTAHWRNQLTWFTLRNFCNKIIAVSENARQFYITRGRIPQDKIITLYNGIDLSAFKQVDSQVVKEKRKALNLPVEAAVLVTVAVLREPKGIQYMINAMPSILATIPNTHYLIVGDGGYRDTLLGLVESLNLGQHISFAGHRKDIPEILAISDIFVLPTLTEALPTVLMEAMAGKNAIIASSVGGVPEMVTDGLNGLLVPPADSERLADACSQLLKNSELRDKMADEGLRIASEKFNIENLIQSLYMLYDEQVKHGR